MMPHTYNPSYFGREILEDYGIIICTNYNYSLQALFRYHGLVLEQG
jgi:hypothetical protein